MEQAIEFEARRQIELIEDGKKVDQETRLYDPDRNETRSMRSKEDAQDYRYFPDPDLLPLVVTDKMIDDVRKTMPELPEARRKTYVEAGLSAYQADLLTSSRAMASLADEAFKGAPPANIPRIANLIAGPLAALLNENDLEVADAGIAPGEIRTLAARISEGVISSSTAAPVILRGLLKKEGLVDDIIRQRDLAQVSDSAAIEKLVDEAIAAGAKQVADYRAGKEKALQSLVGQVMKASKGKANPAQVNEILRRKLGG
jgi:aspartyl-tRNA(Asn)/glutamyl-tRNA(Gln) amidotransferase subunit B